MKSNRMPKLGAGGRHRRAGKKTEAERKAGRSRADELAAQARGRLALQAAFTPPPREHERGCQNCRG